MGYSPAMNKNLLPKIGKTGLMLGAALAVTLTGCVGYVDRPQPSGQVYAAPPMAQPEPVYVAPPVVQVEPAYVAPVVVVEDDYVYYPQYEMYYGSRSHQYFYLEGGSWVGHREPRGVSVNVLFGSPSVAVGFHDHLEMHHAEVVRSYPRNWRPPAANRVRKEDQRNDNQR
jgi:hypothetical protein